MAKYRKKPVIIDAVKYTGDNYWEIVDELQDEDSAIIFEDPKLSIQTLDSIAYADVGDWVLKGTAGEFYPCKPDIFEQTYEEV